MGSAVFTSTYSTSQTGAMTCRVRIGYTESYDPSANQTTVRISSVELQKDGNGANWGSLPFFGVVRVNGTALLAMNGSPAYVSLSGGGYCGVSVPSSASVALTHDDDGSKSVSFALGGGLSFEGNDYFGALYGGVPFGVRAQTQTVALETHPRASSIAACPSSAATQTRLSLTMSRRSSAFYHKASFLLGDAVLYTSAAFASSLSYTIPRSWFSSSPNADTLNVTVSVQTYTDSSCTSAVGSPATAALTVTADEGMAPSVSAGWYALEPYNTGTAAEGITGCVKGYSRIKASFDDTKVTNAVGASVASHTVSCQGAAAIEAPYLTGVLSSTLVDVTCTVTDTRGRSTSETVRSLAVMDYSKPRLSGISVYRSDGSGTAKEDGEYITVKATQTFSSLNGQNSCTLGAAYAASGGSYGAETALTSGVPGTLGPLSADTSYRVRIRAADTLGNSAVFYASVPTRKWAMKFRANGRGVAFGKAAETDDRFEVSSDWDVKLGRPLPLTSGGTGGATLSAARENLGVPLYTMNAGTDYSFTVTYGTRFLFFTSSGTNDAKGLYIFNVSVAGASPAGKVTWAEVRNAPNITIASPAALGFTVRSVNAGSMGFIIFNGSVTPA